MQKVSAPANRVTNVVLVVASRIRRHRPLRTGLIGLSFLALLHDPVQNFGATTAANYNVVLSWGRSTSTAVNGYRIYYGTASGGYTKTLVVGNATTQVISGLTAGVPYFFAIRATTVNGLESAFSPETRFVPGQAMVQLRPSSNQRYALTVSGLAGRTYDVQATQDFKTWSVIGTVVMGTTGSFNFTDTNMVKFSRRFYRTLQKN